MKTYGNVIITLKDKNKIRAPIVKIDAWLDGCYVPPSLGDYDHSSEEELPMAMWSEIDILLEEEINSPIYNIKIDELELELKGSEHGYHYHDQLCEICEKKTEDGIVLRCY